MKAKLLYLILLFSSVFMAHAQGKINLENWMLGIPEGTKTNFICPELLNYNDDIIMQKYMFNDGKDKSLVFYALPPLKNKKNYVNTDLREVDASGKKTSWNFEQGGNLKLVCRMGDISEDNGRNPEVVFMQLNSKITKKQMILIGESSDLGPIIFKAYWDNGLIRIKTRILKNNTITGNDVLKTKSSWTDNDPFTFKENVGFDKFTFEVKVTKDAMEIILNNKEKKIYSRNDIVNYLPFVNFFSFGCSLQSDKIDAFANMKFYSADVSHKK